MDSRVLVELKMELEFGVGPVGDRLPLATNAQDDQPLVLVSRVDDGDLLYLREDIPARVQRQLRDVGAASCFEDEARVRAILDTAIPCRIVRCIRWYTVARRPDRAEYFDVIRRGDRFVIVIDGREVAWTETDWENDRAAEVSVETLEGYRRRGFARQVTAAWAAAMLDAGKVGFYSHRMTNDASRAVAVSLGLTHLSDEVEYI